MVWLPGNLLHRRVGLCTLLLDLGWVLAWHVSWGSYEVEWTVSPAFPVPLVSPWSVAHSNFKRIFCYCWMTFNILTHSASRISLSAFSAASCLAFSSSANFCWRNWWYWTMGNFILELCCGLPIPLELCALLQLSPLVWVLWRERI